MRAMPTMNRREALGGFGVLGLSFLFRKVRVPVADEAPYEDYLVEEAPDEAAIPAAVVVEARPTQAFRVERLVIPSSLAELFVIEDIWVGNVTQLAVAGSIPAAAFAADALDNYVSMDAAAAGTSIRFRVRYVGKDPKGAVFYGALIGRVVDGGGDRRHVLPISSGIAIA
jgi:hypothetical protein